MRLPSWYRLPSREKYEHRRLWLIAAPMILANISIPLLGMVDTAILGHLGNAQLLAGSAIAGAILSQLYWICWREGLL